MNNAFSNPCTAAVQVRHLWVLETVATAQGAALMKPYFDSKLHIDITNDT